MDIRLWPIRSQESWFLTFLKHYLIRFNIPAAIFPKDDVLMGLIAELRSAQHIKEWTLAKPRDEFFCRWNFIDNWSLERMMDEARSSGYAHDRKRTDQIAHAWTECFDFTVAAGKKNGSKESRFLDVIRRHLAKKNPALKPYFLKTSTTARKPAGSSRFGT